MQLSRLALGASLVRVLGTAALSAEDAALCQENFPALKDAELCRDMQHIVTCQTDNWCKDGDNYETTLRHFQKVCKSLTIADLDKLCGTYQNPNADIFAPIMLGLSIAVCVIVVWVLCFVTCNFVTSKPKQQYAGEEIRGMFYRIWACVAIPFSCIERQHREPLLPAHARPVNAAFPCAPVVMLVPG